MAGDKLFISYRREDAIHPAQFLHHLLSGTFSREQMFMDLDSLVAGVKFREEIDKALAQSAVFLAVIGDDWLTVTESDGTPRIHSPKDYVRYEIEAALAREEITVIPVLVEDASMPSARDLPESLQALPELQAHELRPKSFASDARPLIKVLERLTQPQPEARASAPAPSPERTIATEVRRAEINAGSLFMVRQLEDVMVLERVDARTDEVISRRGLGVIPPGARVALSVSATAVALVVDRTLTLFDHELESGGSREFGFVSRMSIGPSALWVRDTPRPPLRHGEITTVPARVSRLGISSEVSDAAFNLGDEHIWNDGPPGVDLMPSCHQSDHAIAIVARRGGRRLRGSGRASQKVIELNAHRDELRERPVVHPPWVRQLILARHQEHSGDDWGLKLNGRPLLERDRSGLAEWVDSRVAILAVLARPGQTAVFRCDPDGTVTEVLDETASMLSSSHPVAADLRGPAHLTVSADARRVWIPLREADGSARLIGIGPAGTDLVHVRRETASIPLGSDDDAVYYATPVGGSLEVLSAPLGAAA